MLNAAMVAILLGAFHVKKSTASNVSHINNVICVWILSATNVNKQKRVRGWTVKLNFVRIASRGGRATVAVKLGVGIVLYLIFVITVTAAKEYALTALSLGVAGVASVMVADWNFVPMTVDTTYKNAVKKMGKAFVLIVHLRVRVCIDGRYGIYGMRFI